MWKIKNIFSKRNREIIPQKISQIVETALRSGGVGVLPTDTLYGICASAFNSQAVEKIYKLRKRELKKPMIVLLSNLEDVKLFDIKLNADQQEMLGQIWPGKVSVALSCSAKKFSHLNRGGKTVAFRVPADKSLQKFLQKTGPLVAPSANLAGEKPATTIKSAKKYFADKIDFYVDAGKLSSKPSTLIKIDDEGKVEVLRSGAEKIARKFLA